MNNRKYHTNPDELLSQGKTIMTSSEESKYLFKVFAVNMVLSGTSAAQVGVSAGVTRATVSSWVKTADEKGFEALHTKERSGRPSKLSSVQLAEIDIVLQSNPEEYGFKIWDGPTLSEYIKSTYGIEISVRSCQRIFHQLNFSRIRPQPYPSKDYEDTDERNAFKKKREEIEADDSLILIYQDEVHFQIQTTVTAAWYKKGSAPKIKSFPSKSKVSYSGFVIPESGILFTVKLETFNYMTTIDSIRAFLANNPAPKGKKYALVMDNASWHKKTVRLVATEALPEYADIRESVIFVKFPPYSPDLNPIEQVWRITRKENTHNVFFPNLSTLVNTVDSAFNAWSKPNNQLHSLCSFK